MYIHESLRQERNHKIIFQGLSRGGALPKDENPVFPHACYFIPFISLLLLVLNFPRVYEDLLYFSFYFCLRFPHDQVREIVINFQKIFKRRKGKKREENVILVNTEGISKNNNFLKKNLNQNQEALSSCFTFNLRNKIESLFS